MLEVTVHGYLLAFIQRGKFLSNLKSAKEEKC